MDDEDTAGHSNNGNGARGGPRDKRPEQIDFEDEEMKNFLARTEAEELLLDEMNTPTRKEKVIILADYSSSGIENPACSSKLSMSSSASSSGVISASGSLASPL